MTASSQIALMSMSDWTATTSASGSTGSVNKLNVATDVVRSDILQLNNYNRK